MFRLMLCCVSSMQFVIIRRHVCTVYSTMQLFLFLCLHNFGTKEKDEKCSKMVTHEGDKNAGEKNKNWKNEK